MLLWVVEFASIFALLVRDERRPNLASLGIGGWHQIQETGQEKFCGEAICSTLESISKTSGCDTLSSTAFYGVCNMAKSYFLNFGRNKAMQSRVESRSKTKSHRTNSAGAAQLFTVQ